MGKIASIREELEGMAKALKACGTYKPYLGAPEFIMINPEIRDKVCETLENMAANLKAIEDLL